MQTRQVTLQAPATNTTQNYTVSGFGTPEAAIILSSSGSSGSWTNNGMLGLGFWDGTNQNVTGMGYTNGDTLDGGAGRQFWSPTDVVWYCVNGSSTNVRQATVTNTVTDGIELTWSGTSTGVRPYVTVILFKNLNGAQTGFRTASDTDTGTTQTTTTGITPKLILFAGRLSDVSSEGSGSTPRTYFGFACDNGATIDNYSVGWRQRHDTNPTDMNGQVLSDACIPFDVGTFGTVTNSCAVTAMTSGSFTTTSTIGETVFASSHNYLALDFDESVVGFSAATPTSAGDFDPYTASFQPQWFFAFPTGFAATDTAYSDDQDGVEGHHIYSVNKFAEEDSHNAIIENGSTDVTLIYSQGAHYSGLQINRVSATPGPEDLITGSSPSFDASGVVYTDANFSHDTGQAHQIIGFFVGDETGSTIAPQAMYHYRNHGKI